MDHDPWLIKEIRRITTDLAGLQTSLDLVPHKFKIGFADSDAVVVVGDGEWRTMNNRVGDAREEIVTKLNDFIDNEFDRQLHWSALRMLTASGVLSTELSGFYQKLSFINSHPGKRTGEAQRLIDWFEGQILPVSQRLSTRLLQFISRVLDPESWAVAGSITGDGPLQLTMSFQPKTEQRWRQQKEKEERLKRIRID